MSSVPNVTNSSAVVEEDGNAQTQAERDQAFRARKRVSVPYDQRNSPKLSVAPPPDPAEPPASVGLGGEEKTKASNTVNDVPKTSKLIIHHLENSRSQRILWLLEELEIPYEFKAYMRTPENKAPPELKKVHPLGISPVIQDGDLVLAESGAIIEYIISKYGEKLKPNADGYIHNLFFVHYAEGSLMPALANKLLFKIIPNQMRLFVRPLANLLFSTATKAFIDPQIETHRQFITDHLNKSLTGWFAHCDHPTAADFQMFFALEALRIRVPDAGHAIEEYVKRVKERPAYKRALAKSGGFVLIPVR